MTDMDEVERLLDAARTNIMTGRLLVASRSTLDSASQLMKMEGIEDIETEYEIASLKGIVARDTFDLAEATVSFDLAMFLAEQMGDADRLCEMALAKATAAATAYQYRHAEYYLRNAIKTIERHPPSNLGLVGLEVAARKISIMEMRGDAINAEAAAIRYFPQVLELGDPDLVVSRIASRVRLCLANRGGLPTRDAEKLLAQANGELQYTTTDLRRLQFHAAAATFLAADEDPDSIIHAKTARRILVQGQFRHRPTEALLARLDLELPSSSMNGERTLVNYNISGDGNNISIGGSNFTQNSHGHSSSGNKMVLFENLRAAGVSESDILDLDEVLKDEEKLPDSPGPGLERWRERVSGFTEKVATGAAVSAINKAIAMYFGLE